MSSCGTTGGVWPEPLPFHPLPRCSLISGLCPLTGMHTFSCIPSLPPLVKLSHLCSPFRSQGDVPSLTTWFPHSGRGPEVASWLQCRQALLGTTHLSVLLACQGVLTFRIQK